MTAFLAITDAVRAALMGAPALAGGNVRRGRHNAMPANASQAIDVSMVSSRAEPVDLSGGALQWESAVMVVCKARGSATADAEAAIDPLVLAAWQRLYGMAAPSGVVGMVLDPSIAWDVDEADQPIAVAALQLRLTHITTAAELAA